MESHLLQMRGLKRLPLTLDARTLRSHLLQMRGLKLPANSGAPAYIVASFTDAWIETGARRLPYKTARSRIFYRCVD